MNKIVNGVANDYEFPMYYESNIKTSRDKDSVVVMTYVNQEKEIERLKNNYLKAIKKIGDIDKERNNLQERIDKAIEYIEEHTYDNNGLFIYKRFYPDFYIENVLDILKGKENE